MRSLAVFLVVTMLSATSRAAPPPRSGAELLAELRRLSVVGSVLYVAAHPDDENTRLLASLALGQGVRTAYLSMTRGEGGQNLIGPELGPLLGVIRTQELLAARRLDGAEQFFTRARDFGYSKRVEETLQVWDHDAVLLDVVRVVRTLQPDVILTRFPLEAGDTHGHHTASARLAAEAFRAAGDAAFEPGALAGLPPWHARRLLWNAWSGDRGPPVAASLTYETSTYSPLLGRSYGEVAALSRSMHRSQGFGAAPAHGPVVESFVLLDGEPGTSLFDGVDLTWNRLPGGVAVARVLERAAREFSVEQPARSLPTLFEALEALTALPEHPQRARALERLREVIAACAGLHLDATASSFAAVPGGLLEVTPVALNRSPVAVTLEAVRLGDAPPLVVQASLAPGVTWSRKVPVQLPAEAALSTPAWLEALPAPGMWTVARPELATAPERPPALEATFELAFGPHRVALRRPVGFAWVDPTVGERVRPLEVLPAVEVAPDVPQLMFTDLMPRTLSVRVTANADAQAGGLTLELPAGWSAEPSSRPFTLAHRGDAQAFTFSVKPGGPAARAGRLTAVAQVGERRFTRGLTRVEYPHVPIQTVLPPAEVTLGRVELATGGRRLGYVEGAGDEVAQALRQVGYSVTVLDDEALQAGPLGGYDAIVVGIRAFNVKARLAAAHARLMQYVADGGTLLVQYNTRNWLSQVPAELGPFPFVITQDRVTDETAAVTFTAPFHPVLLGPNRLGPADFEGWVQERGLYFGGSWDPRYQTPLAMHDPGEPDRLGSLLVAPHGKGRFVYTGLAFFRQLPAGVPGAYRLFANLLAHGR